MGEGQVSVDGESRKVTQPFVVLAPDKLDRVRGVYKPRAQFNRVTGKVILAPFIDAAGLPSPARLSGNH